MEGVLTNPKVRPRIAKLCVGLGAPADPPEMEQDLLIYLSKHFEGKGSLPYIVFLTHDRKWVRGFSDTRTLAQFLDDLDKVEQSPLVPASKEVETKLATAAKQAEHLVEAEDWVKLMALVRSTKSLTGRCAQRNELDELTQSVRDHAAARFDWVEETVASEGAIAAAKKELKSLQKLMKGEPEADIAATGVAALFVYARVGKLKDAAATKARAAAAKQFAGGRWAALFDAP